MTDSPEPLSAEELARLRDGKGVMPSRLSLSWRLVRRLIATLDAERRLQFEHHQFHHAGGFAASERPPVDPLREALAAGMGDALTVDWPGDTRLRTAPAIVDYLLALPAVRAALASPATPRPEGLDVERLILDGIEAFRLTREYVGEDTLPAIEGWSWFDWCEKARAALSLSDTGERPIHPDGDHDGYGVDTDAEGTVTACAFRGCRLFVDHAELSLRVVSTTDEMRAALIAIRDMEPDPIDESLPDHFDCAECQRIQATPYHVATCCDDLYRAISRRDRLRKDAGRQQQWRMRTLARDALESIA